MDFRRKLTATDKNGSPITYEPILRSQSDVEYTETLKNSLMAKISPPKPSMMLMAMLKALIN